MQSPFNKPQNPSHPSGTGRIKWEVIFQLINFILLIVIVFFVIPRSQISTEDVLTGNAAKVEVVEPVEEPEPEKVEEPVVEDKSGMVCNKPYIVVGNDCCLDKDGNSICDKDETTAISLTAEDVKAIALDSAEEEIAASDSDCHLAHEGFNQPDFSLRFELGEAKIASIKREVDSGWAVFELVIQPTEEGRLHCDAAEYYNNVPIEEFEIDNIHTTREVEPMDEEGTRLVNYRVTCYNAKEYEYKDTCDTIKSKFKSGTLLIEYED